MLSCTNRGSCIPLLEEIKKQGDADPVAALRRTDSLSVYMAGESRHTVMQYELLKIRLQAKAEIMPSSDSKGKEIYDYFMEEGDDEEKIEACFYLANIYRNLHDSPRAISFFRQALDIAASAGGIDSVMVANTYSQLSALYRIHYDYNTAMEMAEKGLEVAKKKGFVDPIYIMDVATIAYYQNDTLKTIRVQQEALDMIRRDNAENEYPDVLCEILQIYSEYHKPEEAAKCKTMVEKIEGEKCPHNYYSALASYYSAVEKTDSAIYYNKLQLDGENTTMEENYAASLNLASIYNNMGDAGMARIYAFKFIEIEEEYRKLLQHEQAVKANNEYVYNRNRAEEEKAYREAEEAKAQNMHLIYITFLVLVSVFILFLIQRYRALKRIHENMVVINEKEMQIREQEEKIENSQQRLDFLTGELKGKEQEVAEKDAKLQKQLLLLRQKGYELENAEKELREKESLLFEKLEQNKKLFGYAFTENMRKTSGATLQKFNDAARGKRTLTDKEWKELFSTIEKLYPGFRGAIVQKIKRPRTDILRIAYLLKAGMSNPQIESLTNYPTTTVWRKVKNLTELLGDDLHSIY